MSNKKPAGKNRSPKLATVAKPSGPHRLPPVTPNPPKMAAPGRRIKLVDAKGRQRLVWEKKDEENPS